MSLKIFFGSDTTLLAKRLAGDIVDVRRGTDPLRPLTVLVPNRNLEKWLRFELARRNGIAANIVFPYLEKGLWNLTADIGMAGGIVGDDGAGRPRVAEFDSATVRSRIAARMLDQAVRPAVGPRSSLVQYCLAGGTPDEAGFAIRLWQMAGRLADLFREYEFSRTAMVRGWLAGRATDESDRTEAEQAALYREVCAVVRRGSTGDIPRMSLFQLAEKVFRVDDQGRTLDSCRPGAGLGDCAVETVFVFGMSSMSPYHCRLLHEISRWKDVVVYHLNVCHEFWEDVSTPREDRWQAIRNAKCDADGELALNESASENPLLKAWGKAGRETIKLLADLDDQSGRVDVAWVGEDPADPDMGGWSVLDRVRYGIRNRTSECGRTVPDESVTLTSCPGPEREVETVYEQIVGMMRADPGLRLSDIAVLVTDMATYKPLVSAVFEREEFPVPYNLADSNARVDSMFGAGVTSLLSLADSDFSRRAVFDLLYNPCFIQAAGVGVADVDAWLEWAGKLGVYHDMRGHVTGADGRPADLYSWGQALRRIRLGRLMEVPTTLRVGDEPGPEGLFSPVFPYRDSDSPGVLADVFCQTVERLALTLASLGSFRGSPGEWGRRLSDVFETFLAIPDDRAGEWTVKRALMDGLGDFLSDESGLGAAMSATGHESGISAPLAFEIVRGLLSGIATGRGAYLSSGVTVASLKPMRPIPFKVVFVMGLQEGAFPGTPRESSLDLRRGRHRVGDISTPDAGRYMFLETLLCTGQSLRLSWDGWDAVNDRRHEPCSVVRQVEKHILDSIVSAPPDADPGNFLRREIPLSPHSRGYLAGTPPVPATARRMKDRLVGAMLEAHASRRTSALALLVEQAARKARDDGLDHLPDYEALAMTQAILAGEAGVAPDLPVRMSGPVRIRLSDLARFLENPMQARLQRYFHISGDWDDPGTELKEDEPTGYNDNDIRALKTQWLYDAAVSAGGIERASALLRARGEMKQAMSAAPVDLFRRPAEDRVVGDLEKAFSKLDPPLQAHRWVECAVIGRDMPTAFPAGYRAPAVMLSLPADVVNPDGVVVELSGFVDFAGMGDAGSPAEFVVARPSLPADYFPPKLLLPALFGLADGIGRGVDPVSFVVTQVAATGLESARVTFSRSDALAYMSCLVADYLDDGALFECLPYAPVLQSFGDALTSADEPRGLDDIRRSIQAGIAEGFAGSSHVYYPSEAEELLQEYALVPDDFASVARRRLGLLLARAVPIVRDPVAETGGRA